MTDWIAEARARLDAATPGLWRLADYPADVVTADVRVACCFENADAAFIAAAPTDLRRALDALERVQKLADEWEQHGGHFAGTIVRGAVDGTITYFVAEKDGPE